MIEKIKIKHLRIFCPKEKKYIELLVCEGCLYFAPQKEKKSYILCKYGKFK